MIDQDSLLITPTSLFVSHRTGAETLRENAFYSMLSLIGH